MNNVEKADRDLLQEVKETKGPVAIIGAGAALGTLSAIQAMQEKGIKVIVVNEQPFVPAKPKEIEFELVQPLRHTDYKDGKTLRRERRKKNRSH